MTEFVGFPKIARFNREVIVTEKIDGTNAQIFISEDGEFQAGSRTRWITPENDNHGFARWAYEHKAELLMLGPGRHFGEWWGSGIQRGYGLANGDKRFSLFNVQRWGCTDPLPPCCGVVPILWRGNLLDLDLDDVVNDLIANGSVAAPGFMKPEGVVVFHVAACVGFKRTIEKDDEHKSQRGAA